MIRNILFDMGNVLIHFDRKVFLDRLEVSEEEKQLLLWWMWWTMGKTAQLFP